MRNLPKSIRHLISVLSVIAGIFLLVIIGLTVADVGLRNLAGKSILGTIDISSLLLVSIAFLGLSSAEVDGRHVSVNILEVHLSHKIRCIFSLIRTVLFVAIAMTITWGIFGTLISAIERQETTNGILRILTWPTKFLLLISFFCYFLILIWKSIHDFLDIRDGTEQNSLDDVTRPISTQLDDLSDTDSYKQTKGVQ